MLPRRQQGPALPAGLTLRCPPGSRLSVCAFMQFLIKDITVLSIRWKRVDPICISLPGIVVRRRGQGLLPTNSSSSPLRSNGMLAMAKGRQCQHRVLTCSYFEPAARVETCQFMAFHLGCSPFPMKEGSSLPSSRIIATLVRTVSWDTAC